jgi:hypothetical protein
MRLLVLTALVLQAQTRDPEAVLAGTRDRVIATSQKLTKISCTETFDRSYYHRANSTGRSSCDQLHVDFKKGRYKLQLTATDRLRARVSIEAHSERLFWVDPLPFESHSIEEVLITGPIGTGPFAAFVSNIFGSARIEYVGERGKNLEYRFREPEAASHYSARAGGDWVPTGESGSLLIDPDSLGLEQLIDESSTLPRETSACEVDVTVNYQSNLGKDDPILPRQAEWRDLLVNSDETVSRATFSDCSDDRPAPAPSTKAPSSLPPNLPVSLALDNPIDTSTAAAGDLVSATIIKTVTSRHSGIVIQGAKVRGRILNLEHTIDPARHFLIAISFDTIESGGKTLPLRLELDRQLTMLSQRRTLRDNSSRWPEITLVFPDGKSTVIPRGFESQWLTTK